MGNSITEGWERIMPDFFTENPYINRGISGQTTPQMLIRFRQDVVDLQPAAVVLLAGINDIAGNTGPSTLTMIFNNIQSMAEIAEANEIKVIIASVLPAYDFPWRPGLEPAAKVVALNQMLKSYCQNKGFVYLDYFTPMADERNGLKANYGDDGVHPNLTGYQVMAPLVKAAIAKALLN
jgi:lysophospholipase L1-like esterase